MLDQLCTIVNYLCISNCWLSYCFCGWLFTICVLLLALFEATNNLCLTSWTYLWNHESVFLLLFIKSGGFSCLQVKSRFDTSSSTSGKNVLTKKTKIKTPNSWPSLSKSDKWDIFALHRTPLGSGSVTVSCRVVTSESPQVRILQLSGQSYKAIYDRNLWLYNCNDKKDHHIVTLY